MAVPVRWYEVLTPRPLLTVVAAPPTSTHLGSFSYAVVVNLQRKFSIEENKPELTVVAATPTSTQVCFLPLKTFFANLLQQHN